MIIKEKAKYSVKKYLRKVYANPKAEAETGEARLVKAETPAPLFPHSYALGSLVMDIIIPKYTDALPLEVTGVYNAVTQEKLTGEHVLNEPEEKTVISKPTVEIITKNGGTVNVRGGNGTEYEIIKEVETGKVLEYIATVQNGWNAVKVGTQVEWVSGEHNTLKVF